MTNKFEKMMTDVKTAISGISTLDASNLTDAFDISLRFMIYYKKNKSIVQKKQ